MAILIPTRNLCPHITKCGCFYDEIFLSAFKRMPATFTDLIQSVLAGPVSRLPQDRAAGGRDHQSQASRGLQRILTSSDT